MTCLAPARIIVDAPPSHNARKKSSQKSLRPRGAKDAETFPGAIGRNDACVRGGPASVSLSRIKECIVAVGGFRANANRCGIDSSGCRPPGMNQSFPHGSVLMADMCCSLAVWAGEYGRVKPGSRAVLGPHHFFLLLGIVYACYCMQTGHMIAHTNGYPVVVQRPSEYHIFCSLSRNDC